MPTILYEHHSSEISPGTGEGLWMTSEELAAVTGWTLKPEGFCKGDVCVPVPNPATDYVNEGRVNVSALWVLLGKPVVSSDDQSVWCLGEDAAVRNDAMLSLEAPDFSLPDLNGHYHSLSDFRRKRVLLITWASW